VNGESGLVVPPGDHEALARAIMSLAADPAKCRNLGERARERIRTTFNINDTVRKTIELFKEVVGTRH
jgi:glycosyltransferase involved in cell wall biosynthesis